MNSRLLRLFVYSVVSAAALLSSGGAWAAAADAETQAKQILATSGVKGGLVVHLGSIDARLTAALHANDRFIVHGLDTDAGRLAEARTYLAGDGLYGPVSVQRFNGRNLPYADRLVNLLVVEPGLAVSAAEMQRVLAPLGVICVREGDQWRRATAKAWPDALDDWSHLLHGPDNNAVAKDMEVEPPRRLQWQAGPAWCRSHEFLSSFATMVESRGRIFYVFDEGLTGITDSRLPERWVLIARDAFNGVLLWKRPFGDVRASELGGKALRATSPLVNRTLVADGERVLCVDRPRGSVLVLDAATGEGARTISGTENTDEFILSDGVLLVRVRADDAAGRRGILAVDPATGQTRWFRPEKQYLPMSLAATNGKAVYSNRKQLVCVAVADGKPLWQRDLAGLKMSGRAMSDVLVLSRGHVLLGSGRGIVALKLADGTDAWRQNAGGGALRGGDLLVAGGLAWHAGSGGIVGYDVATGKAVRTLDPSEVYSPGHHLRCYNAKATERFLITPNRGIEFISLQDQPYTQSDWTRGACRYGVLPAAGLLYVPPHPCFCYPGAMMTGLNAYDGASPDQLQQLAAPGSDSPGRLERGPAFGTTANLHTDAATAADWPMYRHDSGRSGATAAAGPTSMKTVWATKLGGELTPPVAAAGHVYVAAKDRFTLYAIGANDGHRQWSFPAGSRIDSPPTIVGSLVLFGCADGWVYCLRAADGALVWRFRAAPSARQIIVDNRIESPWRVHGSLLLHQGIVYLTAGRSSYLDGGLFLYGLDPQSGKVMHQARLDTWSRTRRDAEGKPFLPAFHMEGSRSDLLVSDGEFLFLGQFQFTPSLERVDTPYREGVADYHEDRGASDAFGPPVRGVKVADAEFLDRETIAKYPQMAKRWYRRGHMGAKTMRRHLLATGGFLDDSYFPRTFWMYANIWPGFYIANIAPKTGQILSVGPARTYGVQAYPERVVLSPTFTPGKKGYLLFADDNDNDPVLDDRDWGRDKGMGFSRQRPPVWSAWIPIRVRAMVLAGGRLIVCGPPDVVDPKDPMASFEGREGAVLRAVSADNGTLLAERKLPAPPVFDGLIAAAGGLYMSTTDGQVLCLGGANSPFQ